MFFRPQCVIVRAMEPSADGPLVAELDAQREVGTRYRWGIRAFVSRLLRPREYHCTVAVLGTKIVGYLVGLRVSARACLLVERLRSDLNLPARAREIEEALLAHALQTTKGPLEIVVRETDISRQLILRDVPCRARPIQILKQHFADTGEDGYRFFFEPLQAAAFGPGRGSPRSESPFAPRSGEH